MPDSKEKSLFKEFIESTTLHGIRNVFSGDSKLRRLIWFLGVSCCTAIFIWNSSELMRSYLNNEVVSHVTIVNQDYAKFPAVTICNFNPLRLDYLQKLNLSESALHAIKHNQYDNTVEEELFKNSTEDTTKFFQNAGHQIKDMLLNCTLQGETCRFDDFNWTMTNMGGCFTFDFEKRLNKSGHIVSSGENFGLTMILDAELEKYYTETDQAVGFKVLVHEKDEFPLVEGSGFAIMTGVTTFAAIKKYTVKTLPPLCENKERIGNSLYTKPLCYEFCKSRYVAKQCGCYHNAVDDHPNSCTISQLYGCVFQKEQDFAKLPNKNCSCPRSCEVNSYDVTLSYGLFTTRYDIDLYRDDLNVCNVMEYYHKLYMAENYGSKNYAEIKIYFQDLNFHLVEDIPKYNIHSLLSAAGGMMGLLLGASVITLAEFFDFFISLFKMKWSETKVRTIKSSIESS